MTLRIGDLVTLDPHQYREALASHTLTILDTGRTALGTKYKVFIPGHGPFWMFENKFVPIDDDYPEDEEWE